MPAWIYVDETDEFYSLRQGDLLKKTHLEKEWIYITLFKLIVLFEDFFQRVMMS